MLEGCWAGGLGQNCFSICASTVQYNAENQKQGSRRLNSIVKTKYIDDLGIVYLWDGRIRLEGLGQEGLDQVIGYLDWNG